MAVPVGFCKRCGKRLPLIAFSARLAGMDSCLCSVSPSNTSQVKKEEPKRELPTDRSKLLGG